MKVAIAGGTGMLGQFVVEEFLAQGHQVRVLARNVVVARQRWGDRVEVEAVDVVTGDLSGALNGCDGLHISLSGSGKPGDYIRIQELGAQRLVAAAQKANIGYITLVSGATVAHPDAASFYDNDGKARAEEAVRGSGIPYRIFRPSWFLETLALFVRGKAVSVVGNPTHPQAWLTAADFAPLVLEAHRDRPPSSTQWVGGPEAASIPEASARYAAARGLKVSRLGIGLARFVALLGGGAEVRHAADLMEYFTKVPDQPQGSDGKIVTATGLSQWLLTQGASATTGPAAR